METDAAAVDADTLEAMRANLAFEASEERAAAPTREALGELEEELVRRKQAELALASALEPPPQ